MCIEHFYARTWFVTVEELVGDLLVGTLIFERKIFVIFEIEWKVILTHSDQVVLLRALPIVVSLLKENLKDKD